MTTPLVTRTLAVAGLVAPVWFTAMVVIQGALHPGYSHVAMPISALAALPMGCLQSLTFLVAGVLVVAFVVALHRLAHAASAITTFFGHGPRYDCLVAADERRPTMARPCIHRSDWCSGFWWPCGSSG
jgi:hypothetical protein